MTDNLEGARDASRETVLITGATSGIGEGLARAFLARGARVVVAARSADALAGMKGEGFEPLVLDVASPASVARAAAEAKGRFGAIHTLINNAGVQRILSFRADDAISAAELDVEIDTNLRGLVHMTHAFLPLLHAAEGHARRIVQVGSGLGYVPLVGAPLYSATKAAVHAFTVALREQLRDSVKVVALVPPVVATNLHRAQARKPPKAMALDAFVRGAMRGLDRGDDEVVVGLAKALRIGSRIAPRFFLGVVNKPR